MKVLSAEQVGQALDYPSLVEALRQVFRGGAEAPPRHHHEVPNDPGADGTLLLMPAWQTGRYLGVKVATVFPDNPSRGLPSVMANVLLNDGATGEPLALVAGQPLTNKRTAAASALAADYLAVQGAKRLLMVGTGAMAPEMVRAHCAVRPIEQIDVWGRTPDKARKLAAGLQAEGLNAQMIESLEAGVEQADVISCATMSTEPLIHGAWLNPGQHVDLMGAFKPSMRETDDKAVQVADVFCDTFAGALKEGGDLVQPIASGTLNRDAVLADLFGLAQGKHPGRTSDDQITLFKSTGAALEDLAAAVLAYERSGD